MPARGSFFTLAVEPGGKQALGNIEESKFWNYIWLMHTDDMTIIIRGSFFQILREHMNEALKIVWKWCMTKGLSVNPNKIAAVVFTRKYKRESIEHLKLWRQEINFSISIKYLGVYVDSKLEWKLHLKNKRKKPHFYVVMQKSTGKAIEIWNLQLVLPRGCRKQYCCQHCYMRQ